MKPRDSIKTVTEANTPAGTDTKGKPQKRTRHRRRNEIKEEKGNNSRGRKKTGENLKKKVEAVSEMTPTKPVIESSNPFFIAVCAPETYKPRITSTSSLGMISSTDERDGGGQRNNRTNVFLRQRTRGGPTAPATQNPTSSSSNIHSNRFIHHPALQHSREIQSHSNTYESSTRDIRPDTKINNNGLELSNEVQFPSLGSSATSATTTTTKLNFKEMVMRNSSSSETTNNTSDVIPSVHTTHTTHVTVVSTTRIPPPLIHKSLSTNNIFLAAFRSHDEDYEGDQGDRGDQGDQGDREVVSSSSAGLIDSCDNKYDRLYK